MATNNQYIMQTFQQKGMEVLNKLTSDNFNKLSQTIKNVIKTEEEMNTIITMILERAVKQSLYCIQYVKLYNYLYSSYDKDIAQTFRKVLIIQTNEVFKKHRLEMIEISEKKQEQFFGVLVLIAELYNFDLIHQNLLFKAIFDTLLPPKNNNLSNIDIEGMCHIFKRCGKKLDNETKKKKVNKYIEKLICHAKNFDFRTQVLANQIQEMRNNDWIQPPHVDEHIGHNYFQNKMKYQTDKPLLNQSISNSQKKKKKKKRKKKKKKK
eukprot:11065_1